ncbi:MAG: mandelate racemase/muconate lactonizing enzyme family protein [Candidatus Margulisiibacteriota bacterium]|nr:mandelate racemase/muconate lactonizing enzyme family protein [Candidatus Margulisiibacteriota bacterium]
MKIKDVELLQCDAGWRPWLFIKITTDEGIVGYSECTDSHGSPLGIKGVIENLKKHLIGKDPRPVEKIYWDLYSITRQSPGSIIQKAIGGIENALLDIKAKALGVPVYELFGGPIRDKVQVYWSHCGTTRARAWQMVGKDPLKTLGDIEKLGNEVKTRGFTALKTNIIFTGENPTVYMPGFKGGLGSPELNVNNKIIDTINSQISAFRRGTGDDVGIILDLNFNFKTEGYIKIAQALEKYNLFWVEIDSYDPNALLKIKQSARTSICSGENLYTTRDYRPYLEKHAMDVCSIDIIWNGFIQSKKISDMAELYEINVTPHNYYSHLSTFISAQFCAAIPNLKILEVDIDDVPWKDEIVTEVPEIRDGYMTVPQRPGWGLELNEEVIRAHPWEK